MRFFAALLLVLAALPVAAQERLAIGPGQTLRLHASAGPERPVSATYELELAAGEWIVVVAPAALVDGASTEPGVALSGPKGPAAAAYGRMVHRSTAAGAYMLALQNFHALSVTRYPAGHPVVDPGVVPGEVTIAPGRLGAVSMAVEKMEPRYDDVPPPSGWPARLSIQVGNTAAIHLYRRAALRQMALWSTDVAREVATMIAADWPLEPRLDLPMFPLSNYSVAYVTRPERLRGACFGFLRYIARWTQEEGYPFDRLTYVALGVSRDGTWFAVVTADTEPAALPGQPEGWHDGRSEAYEAALTRAIASNPAALSPAIAELDALATSLSLPCGAP